LIHSPQESSVKICNHVSSYAFPLVLIFLAFSAGCSLRLNALQLGAPPAQPGTPAPPQRGPEGTPEYAKRLNDEAYEMIGQDRYEEALPKLRDAVAIDPTLAEADKNLAIALCDQGRCEEALGPAAEAVRLKPGLDKAHYVLGKALLGVGRYQEAAAEYREALRINGEYDKACLGLGLAHDRLGDAPAAAESFRQAARLKPDVRDYRDLLELAERHVIRPGQPAPAQPPPSADFKGDGNARRYYARQVLDYLHHDQFDLLGQAAAAARSTGERIPGGGWKLALIYSALSEPEGGKNAPDAEWLYQISKLKKWSESDAGSVTARVGLAQAYVGYAWQARGDGRANTVTEEGGRLFQERLDAARRVLDGAKSAGQRCPHWYATMLGVALGQGWDPASYDQLFAEATAFEPSYTAYYEQKAYYLLPRWYGRQGDWARFAEEAASRVGGGEGSALYYRVVMSVTESSVSAVRAGTSCRRRGCLGSALSRGSWTRSGSTARPHTN
jgi:tetratricopeptide (TPR) repeat protein